MENPPSIDVGLLEGISCWCHGMKEFIKNSCCHKSFVWFMVSADLLSLDPLYPRRQEDSEKAGRDDFVSHWFHEDLSVCRWFHEISTLKFWSAWNLPRLKPAWQEAQSPGKILCFGLVVSWQIYLRHSSTTCWRTLVLTSFTSYHSQLFNQSMFLSFLVKTSYFAKMTFPKSVICSGSLCWCRGSLWAVEWPRSASEKLRSWAEGFR